MISNQFRWLLVLLGMALNLSAQTVKPMPEATAEQLPRWRGFNLLEKFQVYSRQPFKEEDYKWIAELGFNFVRLPMDYRCWIVDGNWEKFDEGQFKEIDQAVAWGKQYGVHVCLNFHRAPGYTVAKPAEKTDLWTDAETQRVCALHWQTFARRYKGIPNSNLSFNLFNEPAGVDGEAYGRVAKIMVEAIRKEDPGRLIIADGAEWGVQPCAQLVELKIAQATRGYIPMSVTHYQASWVGSQDWTMPVWPQLMDISGYLYGTSKPDLRSPVVIKADMDQPLTLKIKVQTVSSQVTLAVSADGKELWRQELKSGPGEGPWKKVVYQEEWKVYQNIYDRYYEVAIPAGSKEIKLDNVDGDWMTFNELVLQRGDGKSVICAVMPQWGRANGTLELVCKGDELTMKSGQAYDRQWLWDNYTAKWQEFSRQHKVGVMVGEWGAFNRTPQEVTLRWMEDCLSNYQKANMGWALWNFRGSFGILDSEREDVQYEDFRGHKLDRKMLELLQRY